MLSKRFVPKETSQLGAEQCPAAASWGSSMEGSGSLVPLMPDTGKGQWDRGILLMSYDWSRDFCSSGRSEVTFLMLFKDVTCN